MSASPLNSWTMSGAGVVQAAKLSSSDSGMRWDPACKLARTRLACGAACGIRISRSALAILLFPSGTTWLFRARESVGRFRPRRHESVRVTRSLGLDVDSPPCYNGAGVAFLGSWFGKIRLVPEGPTLGSRFAGRFFDWYGEGDLAAPRDGRPHDVAVIELVSDLMTGPTGHLQRRAQSAHARSYQLACAVEPDPAASPTHSVEFKATGRCSEGNDDARQGSCVRWHRSVYWFHTGRGGAARKSDAEDNEDNMIFHEMIESLVEYCVSLGLARLNSGAHAIASCSSRGATSG